MTEHDDRDVTDAQILEILSTLDGVDDVSAAEEKAAYENVLERLNGMLHDQHNNQGQFPLPSGLTGHHGA